MSDALGAMSSRLRSKDRLDLGLACGLIALGFTGVVMIYSATRQALIGAGYNPHYYLERQAVFVCLGVIVMYIVSLIDYRRLEIVTTPLYVCGLLSLVGVYVIGSSAQGALRWYSVGIFQIQPSEFTVLILILAIATFCQRRPDGLTMYDVARLLVMAAVPLVLIVVQPDLGTAIIMVLSVGAMLVVAGVPPRLLTLLAVLGTAGVAAAFYLDLVGRYAINRFEGFLHQNSTSAQWAQYIYNVDNAKNAIGSGGLHGAGLFKGLQTNLGYVPEQHTDFIFTAIGEQLGFIGSLLILLLLAFVAFRLFRIGRLAKDQMGRIICIGVFVFFSFSCFENIGMTMGIVPVTGIPLPLLSYGGSAALVFFTAGGLVLSVSRRSGN
ncbi:MAG TPA: FtsW/RodA/SpoVE family cell cycle protein [Acidimicrobiales bacterium]|nr:FtsW/RodA/SpoVE family cell cycle protein [Acidimicrobiales bacterium]